MSLDVYLYVMVDVGVPAKKYINLFDANITHNLKGMADEAGIYGCVWRPLESGYKQAKDIIEPLSNGIVVMENDRVRFTKLNAPNGWGTYENFLPWLKKYLAACQEYPKALISVSG